MVKALIKATAIKVIKKKKPTPNLPNNYVKVPKKYLNTEQSILKKIDQNTNNHVNKEKNKHVNKEKKN